MDGLVGREANAIAVTYLVFPLSDVVLHLLHLLGSIRRRHVPTLVKHLQAEHDEQQDGHPAGDVWWDELDENHSEYC